MLKYWAKRSYSKDLISCTILFRDTLMWNSTTTFKFKINKKGTFLSIEAEEEMKVDQKIVSRVIRISLSLIRCF